MANSLETFSTRLWTRFLIEKQTCVQTSDVGVGGFGFM